MNFATPKNSLTPQSLGIFLVMQTDCLGYSLDHTYDTDFFLKLPDYLFPHLVRMGLGTDKAVMDGEDRNVGFHAPFDHCNADTALNIHKAVGWFRIEDFFQFWEGLCYCSDQ